VLKFLDEEAPSAIQAKTLYTPKPEIQVSTPVTITINVVPVGLGDILDVYDLE